MNKKTTIIIAVSLAVIVSIAILLFLVSPKGPPLSNAAFVYPVTMTGSVVDSEDPAGNGTITVRMQNEETWSMTLQRDEDASEIVYADNSTYIQDTSDGTWIKLSSQDNIENPLDTIRMSEADFDEYEKNAKYVGMTECSQGLCDTWEWQDPTDPNSSATLKLHNGVISEVYGKSGEDMITLVYDYDSPVNIQIPTNAEDLTEQ